MTNCSIKSDFMLDNIIQKSQSISPARKSLLSLSLSLFMISKGSHKSVPAQVPRGFLNNTTSHLFQISSIKWIKFLNRDKSYNFVTKPKNKTYYKIYEGEYTF
jgi:hypothetical protein